LVARGAEHGIPVVEDLGSGLLGGPLILAGSPAPGTVDEHVRRVVDDGVDLVTFSGDKLLGGPQAGIVVGKAALVEKLRRHPLYRAMRLDKMSLAALESTLRMVREGREAEIPVRAMLGRTPEDCREIGERIAQAVAGATLEADVGFSGGGALPGESIPTTVVAVRGGNVEAWAANLRTGSPPVVGRIARGALIIDPRTLLPQDVDRLIGLVNRVISAG
jgi:L-seryl-tRNA(Ser) seleniumtransferase